MDTKHIQLMLNKKLSSEDKSWKVNTSLMLNEKLIHQNYTFFSTKYSNNNINYSLVTNSIKTTNVKRYEILGWCFMFLEIYLQNTLFVYDISKISEVVICCRIFNYPLTRYKAIVTVWNFIFYNVNVTSLA